MRGGRLLGLTLALVAIGVVLFGRGNGSPAAAGTDATTVILVRHAEKADDGTGDPPLTDAGHARARALAAAVADAGIAAIYATPYRRTRQTASPVAERLDLPVTTVEVEAGAEAYADAQARRIVDEHAGETVIVVSHSNTVPPLVEALGGSPIAPIPDHEYDRFVVVLLRAGGSADVIETRYGAPGSATEPAAAAR